MTVFMTLTDFLQERGILLDQIQWAGCTSFSLPLHNFLALAWNTPDNGGGDDLPYDLIVVGDNFCVGRSSDCQWELQDTIPNKPSQEHEINALNFKDQNCKKFGPASEALNVLFGLCGEQFFQEEKDLYLNPYHFSLRELIY